VRPSYSISELVSAEELSNFIVLTGLNGAGKSNLLQAITDGAIAIAGMTQPPTYVRMFSISQFVSAQDSQQTPAGLSNSHIQLFETVKGGRALTLPPNNLPAEQLEQALRNTAVNSGLITEVALNRMIEKAAKPLEEFTIEDFRNFAPLIIGRRDPFQVSATEIFLSYHARRNRNDMERWFVSQGRTDVTPLVDEDFLAIYGPPPWELLTDTLRAMGLQYSFVAPEGSEENRSYIAQLLDHETDTLIPIDRLSSGEKTLLTVALTMYSGNRLDGATEMPRVLLLDEADASLHPSMVKSLVQVLSELFCETYGVKVILTTHSPSTVAVAPEESLYVMRRRTNPRLVKSSRDDALKSLTVGLPTLSVSMDNRRQVFVESEYDEDCYLALFSLIRSRLQSPFSLEFIASGRGGQGNSIAVRHLVTSLRNSGNSSVMGVLDRDERGGAPDGIVFSANRYALENLVLDPLTLGIYLLRERIVANAEMNLPSDLRHFNISDVHAQAIIDYVVGRVDLGESDPLVTQVGYLDGFRGMVPEVWLSTPGHVLETAITDAFLPLRALGKGLKLAVVNRAMADLPGFVPTDVESLFRELLSAA
jgi:ABC-type transport system involved in cytochrome c biogenesis ATPase subunit